MQPKGKAYCGSLNTGSEQQQRLSGAVSHCSHNDHHVTLIVIASRSPLKKVISEIHHLITHISIKMIFLIPDNVFIFMYLFLMFIFIVFFPCHLSPLYPLPPPPTPCNHHMLSTFVSSFSFLLDSSTPHPPGLSACSLLMI